MDNEERQQRIDEITVRKESQLPLINVAIARGHYAEANELLEGLRKCDEEIAQLKKPDPLGPFGLPITFRNSPQHRHIREAICFVTEEILFVFDAAKVQWRIEAPPASSQSSMVEIVRHLHGVLGKLLGGLQK